MAESLLENYNPLYDVHLRQYFALPHMQKHLRRMGLLDSNGVPVAQNGNVESELYARHHAMMDMMLRNRERVLMQLAELQKKYDAAEKVEVYRRVRSGATNPDEFARNHLSRSLSRPRRAATQPPKSGSGRRRHSSNSFEDTEVINRIEKTYEQPNQVVINPKSTYDRLAANAFKYQFLHKLDDSTLSNYKESLAKQLQKLQRFRDISFGPHSVARHQPSLQTSWFFRRRSLKSVKNGTANSAEPHRRHGKSQSPRRHANVTHHQRRKSPQKAISSAPHRLPPISTAASKPKSPPSSQPSKPVGIVAGVAAAGAAVAASVGAVLNGSDEKASEKGTPPKSTTPEPIEASSPVPVRQLSESPPPVPTPPPIHPADEHMDTESDAEEGHRDKRSVSFDDHESEQHTDQEDHDEHQSEAGATESEVSVPATPPGDHEVHAAMTQSMYQGVPEDFNEKHISLDSLNEQPSETHEDEEEPVTPHGDAPASQGHDDHHDDVEERQSEVHVSVEAASPREEQHFEEFYERPYSTEVKHENYDIQETEAKHEEEHHEAPASPNHSEPEDTLTAPDVPEGLPEDREPSPETDNPIEDKSVPIVEDASELRRYSEHSPVIEITEAEPRVLTDDEEEHHDHHDEAEDAPKPASNEVSPPQESTEQVSEHDPVNSDDEEHVEQVRHEPAAAAPDSESAHHDDQSVHSEHGHDSEHEHLASEHADHTDAGSEHCDTESHHDAESVHGTPASARSVTSVHHDDAASEHHSEHPHDDAESVHSVSASVRSIASSHHEAVPEHDDHHDDAASEHRSEHGEHHDNASVHSEAASARSVRSVHDDAAPEHHSEHHDTESHHDAGSVHDTPASARSVTSVHHDDAASEHYSEHPHDDAESVHSVSASVRSLASSHHDAASVHHDDVADHDDHHSKHESVRAASPVAESVHHETEPEHHEEHPDDVSVHHSETGSVHNAAAASPRSVASAQHDEPASEHVEHHDDAASKHHDEHADHHDTESVHSVSASVRSLASSHHGEAASEDRSEHHNAESVHGTPASARSITSVHDAASEHHSEHPHDDAESVHSVSASVRSLASSHHDAPSEHHDDHHSEHESAHAASPTAESVHHDDAASVHSHSEVHSVRSGHPSEHGSVQDVHHDVDEHNEPTHVEHVIEPREVTTSHSTHTTVIHETSYSSRDGTTNSVRHDTYEVRGNDDGSADVHHETFESTDGAPAEVKKEDYTVDGGAVIEGHASPVVSEHGSHASHAVSDGHRAGSPAASEHSIVEHSDAESQKGGVDPMNQSIYVTSEDHHDGAEADPHDQFHEEIVEQATARSIDSFEKHEAELSEPRQSIPNYLESPNIQITAPSDAGDLDHVNDNISAASTPISPAGNKTFPGEPETHEEHHSETVTTTDDNGTKTSTTTSTTTTTTNYQSMVINHDNNGNDNESDVEDEEHANLLGNGNGHDAEAEDSGSDAGGTSSVVHHKTVAGESTTYHFTRSDDELSETGAGQL
uniref:GLTSCR1 domain-containing protein n=1 Tax=Panagrellus redivivus TaxID=6233 RepID=A0A7E4V2U7_PANRE